MKIGDAEIRFRGRIIRAAYLDGEGYQFVQDPVAAIQALRQSRARVDLFTFIQRLSDRQPKYAYPVEWDNMAALPVSTFDHWMKNQIDFKVRNKVRKSAKHGVVVREVPFDDELIRGVSNIYNESPIRQGMRFWHYRKDLETVRRINATFMDRSIYIGAYLGDQLIGFVKLVTDEDRSQAGLMQIVSMIQHRDKAPQNALIAQSVKSCAERGIPYLWYAKMSYGNKQSDTLAEFKLRNGFEKVELPRYYVPLTLAGRAALRLGLHRSMAERVPEPVIAAFRKLRSSWYDKRFPLPSA